MKEIDSEGKSDSEKLSKKEREIETAQDDREERDWG